MTEVDEQARPVPVPVSFRPAAAVLLVVLGLGLCVLWKIASGTEQHSWDRGAVAPSTVALTSGAGYAISVPGGVSTAVDDGVPTRVDDDATYLDLSCTISGAGSGPQQLTVTDEQVSSNATQQIGSFVSAVTGDVQISCNRIPSVFVDDADGAGFDYAGLLLWLGAIALAVGLPLGLSVLRDSADPSSNSAVA